MNKERITKELKNLLNGVGEKFNEIKLRDLKEDEMYMISLRLPSQAMFAPDDYAYYFSDTQEFDIDDIEFELKASSRYQPKDHIFSTVCNPIDFINEDNIIVKTTADGYNNIIEREVRFQDELVFVEKIEYDTFKRPTARLKYFEYEDRFDRYLFNYDEKTMLEIKDSKLKSITFYKDNLLEAPDFGIEYDDNEQVIQKTICGLLFTRFDISIVNTNKEEEQMDNNNSVDLFNEFWKSHIIENIASDLTEEQMEQVIDEIVIDEHLWGFINQSIEDMITNIKNESYETSDVVKNYLEQKEKFINDFLNDIKNK